MTGDQEWWAAQRRLQAQLAAQQGGLAQANAQQAAQRQQAQQAQQSYAYQSALMAQQAGHQADARAQDLAGRSAISAQEANQQAALAAHHTDLQARLQQVTLDQTEEARLQKLKHARASIEDNADLSPGEQHMLITQLESGLNPLENREREAGIIQSTLQSHQLAQQTDQQATLFSQHQERLAQTAQGRTTVLTDPLTGRRQLFMMDLNGNYQPLDFSQSQARDEVMMAHTQAQTEATQQNTTIQGMMAPGAMTAQDLNNRRLQQAFDQANRINPLEEERLRGGNALLAQQIIQNPQSFNLQQALGYQHLAGLRQEFDQRARANPHDLDILESRATVARAQAQLAPQNAQAQVDFQRAQADHMQQLVMNMPNVAQAMARYGADTDHARATASIAQAELTRIQAGGLPWQQAGAIVNHAVGSYEADLDHLRRQIQDAPASQRPALQARYDQLRGNRAGELQRRGQEAEDVFRAVSGMPAANRPQAPAGNAAPQAGGVQAQPFDRSRPNTWTPPQQQAMTTFTGMRQRIGQLPRANRDGPLQAVSELEMMLSTYGSPDAMPQNIRQRYELLGEQLRNLLPAATPRGPWNNPRNEPNPFPAG